jgi:hypothetical protein
VLEARAIDGATHPFHGHEPHLAGFGLALTSAPDAAPGTRLLLAGTAEDAYWRLHLSPGTWSDLGQGLAGAGGTVPRLRGKGLLIPGEDVVLDLDRARRQAPAVLILGLSALGAPASGGTLVPAPDQLIGPAPTDAQGLLAFSLRWPDATTLPPGASLWAQAWIEDDGAPFGLSASNAVRADVP